MSARIASAFCALVASSLCLVVAPASGGSVWTGAAGDSSWSNPLNWDTNPSIPNAVDAVADFSRLDIPGDTTVNLNGNKTAGRLIFGDLVPPFPPPAGNPPPAHNWILATGTPTRELTLDVGSGMPVIDVVNRTAQPTSSEALAGTPGAIGDAYNTFVDQTATINVILAGNEGMAKTGYGTLVLTRGNSYTGTTAVRTGTLVLNHAAAGAPQFNILSTQSGLSLGDFGTHNSGGTLSVVGAAGVNNTQSFTGTTINFGDNRILVSQNGANSVNVSLGTVARNPGGALNLTLPTSGNLSAANASIPNVNGIIGGWMTVGTGDTATWAVNDGNGNIVAKTTGFTEVTGAPTIASDPAANVRWSGSTGNAQVNPGVTDINSLLFPDAAVRTLTIPAGSTLRMGASGGIFKSHRPTGVGQGINISQLTVGTAGSFLTAGGAPDTPGELVLNSNGNPIIQEAAFMNVLSTITDNGSGAVRLVKTGNATVQLSTANTYSGGTYITEGRARAQVLGAYGTGDVHVSAGAAAYFQVAGVFSNNLFLSGKGFWEVGDFTSGTIRVNGNGTDLTGTITLLSDVMIVSRGANAAGAIISGKITGNAGVEFSGQAGNLGTVSLSNSANDWTGTTTISGGRVVIAGAGEVIPHGPGKGGVVMLGEGYLAPAIVTVLDLSGRTETVNSLTATGDLSRVFVENRATGTVGTLVVGANDESSTFAGNLRDNGGVGGTLALTKIGTGVFTLANPATNTYSSPTLVQDGTLRVGSTGALSSASTITLGAGTTGGVLDLGGFSPTVGGIAVGGTGGAGNIIASSSTSAPSVLNFSGGAAPSTFAGIIQDSVAGGTQPVGLTVAAGTLTLSGANTYTGPTTLSGGTLIVTGSLASTGNVTVSSGATLSGRSSGAATGRVGNVTLEAGSLVRPGATPADTSAGRLTMSSLTANGGDVRFDLSSGAASDRIVVLGTANFTGASTITPAALVAGTHTLLTAGDLTGTAPQLNAPTGTRSTFNLNFDAAGDVIELTIVGEPKTITWTGAGTPGNAWDLNTTANWRDGATPEKFFNLDTVVFDDGPANRTIDVTGQMTPGAVIVNNSAGNDYTFSGSGGIADSGFGGGTRLTKTGAGKLIVSTANTYLGPTNVENGTLQVGSDQAIPAASVVTLGAGTTSGVLDLAGFNPTVGGLTASGAGAGNVVGNSSASAPSTLNVAAGDTTFAGTIQDTLAGGNQTVALTVSGGRLTLTGANTYSGNTSIATGATLQVGDGGTTGTLGPASAVFNEGTLVFNRGPGSATVPNAFIGNGNIQKVGPGTVVITGDSSIGGTIAVLDGTFQFGDGGTIGGIITGAPITVSSPGVLAFNRSDDFAFPIVITGTGGVRQAGTGRLALSGNSTYTGPTSVDRGVVVVTNNGSLGAAAGGPVTVAGGAAVDLGGGGPAALNLGTKVFRIAGTGASGTGALTNTSDVGYQNAFQRVQLTGDATIGGTGRFDIRGAASQLDLAGFTLTKVGSNLVGLVGTTVSGGNIVVNDGTLQVATTASIPDNGTGNTITFNRPAPGNTTADFFSLTGTVTRPIVFNGDGIAIGNSGGGTSTVGSNVALNGNVVVGNLTTGTGALVLGGNISETGGARSITKTDPTLLALNGNNTYTGATTVDGGTLRVGGSIAASSGVTLNNPTASATPTAFEAAVSQRVRALTVNNGTIAAVTPEGPAKVLVVGNNTTDSPLTIDETPGGTAKVDLHDNALAVDHASGSDAAALATMRSRILTGFNPSTPGGSDGNWQGNGITSSAAAAAPASTGVGYALASDVLGATGGSFLGQTVDGSTVLARQTLLGDTALNGVVNFDDLARLAQNYNVNDGNRHWFHGDFTYDGNVNFDDLAKMAQNYNTSLPAALPGSAAFQEDVARAFAQVPEPGAMSLLAIASACALARRRRW